MSRRKPLERFRFEIDDSDLKEVVEELEATAKQAKFALWRALKRVSGTLRKRAVKGLKDKLQLRRANALRERLKSMRIVKSTKIKERYAVWFGLNDMPVSWFKGTPKQTASGAVFRGVKYTGGFVRKNRLRDGKLTIFRRASKKRLPIREQLYPIYEKALDYVEDEVFSGIEELIYEEFCRELKARVRYNIGEK